MTPKRNDKQPKPLLTETQETMLSYCAKGMTVMQMAIAESVAIDTIKSRLRVIYGLLGVDNRAAAIAAAQGWQEGRITDLAAKVRKQAGALSAQKYRIRELEGRVAELQRDKDSILEDLAKQRALAVEWRDKYDDAVRPRVAWPSRNQGQM